MIITRAPVRLSFAGGGTDLEAYYSRYEGMVVSTTIDKYFYAFLQPIPDPVLQITSSDYQTFYRHRPSEEFFWDGDLSLPRAILHHFGIQSGVSMFLASEIPPGTGLGSSSTATVALIKAISTAQGITRSPQEIAELAALIEIQKLGMPIGKQDQYAAAFGGLNAITFNPQGVTVEPLNLPLTLIQRLERSLLLFFTGTRRAAASILSHQKAASERQDPQVTAALHAVKQMAVEVRQALEQGDLPALGDLLHASWERKKQFAAGVSNDRIDELYTLARANGARGGKIAGAGGGGFLLLYCEEDNQERVTRALEDRGLRRMAFHLETGGAQVLLNAGLRLPGGNNHD